MERCKKEKWSKCSEGDFPGNHREWMKRNIWRIYFFFIASALLFFHFISLFFWLILMWYTYYLSVCGKEDGNCTLHDVERRVVRRWIDEYVDSKIAVKFMITCAYVIHAVMKMYTKLSLMIYDMFGALCVSLFYSVELELIVLIGN